MQDYQGRKSQKDSDGLRLLRLSSHTALELLVSMDFYEMFNVLHFSGVYDLRILGFWNSPDPRPQHRGLLVSAELWCFFYLL